MKGHVALLALLSGVMAVAQDYAIHLSGSSSNTVLVSTNRVTVIKLFWDGRDAGGHFEISARVETGNVVVEEYTEDVIRGIRTEMTKLTRIPTNRIPYVLPLRSTDGMTAIVSRAEQRLPLIDRKVK